MPAATLATLLTMDPLSPTSFRTRHPPEAMGNAARAIAYGGCTLGAAARAAALTVPAGYRAYSLLGSFLGPAAVDEPLTVRVERVRDTRSFATRWVGVWQRQRRGGGAGPEERRVLAMLADFMPAAATGSVLRFSPAPRADWGAPAGAVSIADRRERMLRAGEIGAERAAQSAASFGLAARWFDGGHAPGSVLGETLLGVAARDVRTAQQREGRAVGDMASGDWLRAKHRLGDDYSLQLGALALAMDMVMSFVPLVHAGMFVDDVGACSSLDFALRVFEPKVDLDAWHLREIVAVQAGEARGFNEARLWDERGDLVAHMTQQAIIRPKEGAKM
jgi:acyl-CoA thioesterase